MLQTSHQCQMLEVGELEIMCKACLQDQSKSRIKGWRVTYLDSIEVFVVDV